MTNKRIEGSIETLRENEAVVRVMGQTIHLPITLIPEEKKEGDSITLTIDATAKLSQEPRNQDEEAHYEAMKRVLKELIS